MFKLLFFVAALLAISFAAPEPKPQYFNYGGLGYSALGYGSYPGYGYGYNYPSYYGGYYGY